MEYQNSIILIRITCMNPVFGGSEVLITMIMCVITLDFDTIVC